MPEPVSIQERIIRQVAREVAAISGIGTVRRGDGRAIFASQHLDAVVWRDGANDPQEQAFGNDGPISRTIRVGVAVTLFSIENAALTTGELVERWIAKVENRLLGNRTMVESVTPSKRLAEDSMPPVSDTFDDDEGRAAAVTIVDITFRHDGTSPYTFGAAIPLLEE